jgi:hypothetical protein
MSACVFFFSFAFWLFSLAASEPFDPRFILFSSHARYRGASLNYTLHVPTPHILDVFRVQSPQTIELKSLEDFKSRALLDLVNGSETISLRLTHPNPFFKYDRIMLQADYYAGKDLLVYSILPLYEIHQSCLMDQERIMERPIRQARNFPNDVTISYRTTRSFDTIRLPDGRHLATGALDHSKVWSRIRCETLNSSVPPIFLHSQFDMIKNNLYHYIKLQNGTEYGILFETSEFDTKANKSIHHVRLPNFMISRKQGVTPASSSLPLSTSSMSNFSIDIPNLGVRILLNTSFQGSFDDIPTPLASRLLNSKPRIPVSISLDSLHPYAPHNPALSYRWDDASTELASIPILNNYCPRGRASGCCCMCYLLPVRILNNQDYMLSVQFSSYTAAPKVSETCSISAHLQLFQHYLRDRSWPALRSNST